MHVWILLFHESVPKAHQSQQEDGEKWVITVIPSNSQPWLE